MATIKSQLSLNDGMSAVLKKITSALDTTLASFEQVQRAAGNAMDATSIETARAELVSASRAVDDLADGYRRAAQEEERLNESIRRGSSAMDGMVAKVVSMVGAYMSLSAVKGFVTSSMEAANTQINAQRQLRAVLNNMGAEDVYNTPVGETPGGVLENTLTLGTDEALHTYDAFTAAVSGNMLTTAIQADASQAMTAYDAIVDKAAEIQSRGIYGDEAMIAGAAEFATYFEDANAIMSMMDTLTDYAMGMSGGGALDTTAMVDYATGLGKIMSGSYDAMTKKGFEFTDAQKAIIEGTATEAQIMAELGAEYLSMSSDMQAAATINNVIAEGWGGLYETMSNTPEGKLIQLNNTLGDIKENVGAGIYPAVVDLVDVVQSNTPQIEGMAMGLATMLGLIIKMISGMVEGAISFGSAVADNWSWIAPIIMGVVAALAAYVGYLSVTKAVELASAAGKAALIAAEYAHAAATGTAVAATTAETAAQMGLNAAMLACPITWIILLIIALVVALLLLWENCEGFRNFFVDMWAGQAKALAWFYNSALVPFANGFVTTQHTIIDAVAGLASGVINLIADMAAFFSERLSFMLNGVKSFAGAYNAIAGVAGWNKIDIDYAFSAEGIESARSAALASVEKWQADIKYDFAKEIDLPAFDEQVDSLADQARNFSVVDWFQEKLTGVQGVLDDYINDMGDGLGNNFEMDGLYDNVGDIADSVGNITDALEISNEELKYLRDIAERDAVNRFTTAEIKIDMTGMTNKIDGGADLDGVIRELTDGFTEALLTAAEGVSE